jgi:hypothetical protein
MFQVFLKSLRQLFDKWPMILMFYLVGLVMSLIVARPFYVTFLEEANFSTELDILIKQFDFMVFTDFLRTSGKAFKPFVSLTAFLGLITLVINNFFDGGLLNTWKKEQFNFSDFFAACTSTFGKFLWVLFYSFVSLLVFVSLSGMFFFIFAAIAEGGSEREYILWMIPPCLILLYLISFIIVQNQYTKVIIFENPKVSAWQAFGKAFSFVLSRPQPLFLFWMIGLLGVLTYLLYLALDSWIGMHSGLTIFFMFVIQQLLVLIRTYLKTLKLWSAANYYSLKPINILLKTQNNISETNFDGEGLVIDTEA